MRGSTSWLKSPDDLPGYDWDGIALLLAAVVNQAFADFEHPANCGTDAERARVRQDAQDFISDIESVHGPLHRRRVTAAGRPLHRRP